MLRQTTGSALLATLLATCPAFAQGSSEAAWLPSLMTETPQEGFDLAIKIARKAVTTTQPDTDALHAFRPAYANDPESLIDVSGVVATYFATIAEANGYWRE